MSEEGTTNEGTTAETQEAQPTTTRNFADIVIEDQGLSTVSDEDLQGYDETEEEKPAEEEKPEVKPTEGDEKPATPAPKPEAPPKGFVPTAALHEAREEVRKLKERISALEVKGAAEPPVTPPAVPPDVPTVRPDFKVLTKDEFAELSEESPRDALLYTQELMEYKEAQRITAELARQAEQQKAATAAEVDQLFEETTALMQEAVPGIFDDGSTVQQELSEFADAIGFTKDLRYLTNPETQVILPGETKPLYLGRQAASILKMLADLKTKGIPNAGAADRAAIEAELRPKIEAEILSKIKSGGKTSYKALSDIPTSESSIPTGKAMLSEAEVAKLSPKALQAYLSGV